MDSRYGGDGIRHSQDCLRSIASRLIGRSRPAAQEVTDHWRTTEGTIACCELIDASSIIKPIKLTRSLEMMLYLGMRNCGAPSQAAPVYFSSKAV
ncbi:hypothetical protein CGMCC3_g16838 [Colletotrichum fructicola]|nr:uncharacterized protein CGMCC3_g16838 [Colletotrichum fructicola]KAE9566979.1 hypothetical protein CGMCC3_g16838 [Colletotrichum fructicola]